ncbi:hypothetical protein A3A21_01850 [Candidatus Jorgensenbacteria bacterium RIFCSPLOWO2_01_FULL_45_25b]|uniref:Cohesin domain-containing protein n=1 Tax=Candidatus Jorgensenbacteria bacterium RIFCSPLOWO2_01_FULL_45_25b TaxID=1798471 RepID=A0A1F6BUT9_9BACT|nr:MAG: hypothetical protein A3A21_01850 [Candidatus Jorgensenbacteria bacterium RIFCSPLOWO2_01_FULL_45_25b]
MIASSALAATSASFAPASVSARRGQSFTLTIRINPEGTKNYTAKTELRYPADLIEVRSFTFGSGWMPLSQTGYDLTDNTNGVLVKTAGYPGGVSSQTTFGTVSFFAKKSGNAKITLQSSSFALDAASQNVLGGTGLPQTAIVISEPAPSVATETAPAPVSEPEEEPVVEEEPEVSVVEEELPLPQPTASQPLLAQIGSLTTLGTNNAIVGIFLGAIIIALIAYIIYFLKKNRAPKK